MNKITACIIGFVTCAIWAMFERHYGIGVTDQVFFCFMFMIEIVFDFPISALIHRYKNRNK